MTKKSITQLSTETSNPSDLDPLEDSSQQPVVQSMGFSGPLPPPGLLSEYEHAHPGLSERIIVAFEKEGDHRREMERSYHNLLHKAHDHGHQRASRGQILAFCISLLALSGAIVLGLLGHTVAASVIASVDIAGVTSVFLFERKTPSLKKELPKKE